MPDLTKKYPDCEFSETAVAFEAEHARCGIVTCYTCGAAILLEMDRDTLFIHNAWHARIGNRVHGLEAREDHA